MDEWLAYYERNRVDRIAIPWEQGIAVEPHLREPLIRSLQRFQVGESGDGAHLLGSAAKTANPTYIATLKLFVEEEQEHSRMLARLIHGMSGELLDRHWSDVCFVLLRRLMGLRLELMVLLVAEMIAQRYYRALHDGTKDPVLQAAFAQILRDEAGHVTFHCDYLRGTLMLLSPPLQSLVQLGWWVFFRLVSLVVAVDHRSVLRAVGVSPAVFWRECGQIFSGNVRGIFGAPGATGQFSPSRLDDVT